MGSLNLFVLNREERKTAECDLSDYYVETMGIHDGWSLQVDFYHLHYLQCNQCDKLVQRDQHELQVLHCLVLGAAGALRLPHQRGRPNVLH